MIIRRWQPIKIHMCAHERHRNEKFAPWTQTKSVSPTIIFVPWCTRVWRECAWACLRSKFVPFFSQWRSAKHMHRLRPIRDIVWRAMSPPQHVHAKYFETFSGRCGWCKIIQQMKETNFRVCFDNNNVPDAERSHYDDDDDYDHRNFPFVWHILRKRFCFVSSKLYDQIMAHSYASEMPFGWQWRTLFSFLLSSISDDWRRTSLRASPDRRFTSHAIDVRSTHLNEFGSNSCRINCNIRSTATHKCNSMDDVCAYLVRANVWWPNDHRHNVP